MLIGQVIESIKQNGWMNDLHYLATPYTNFLEGPSTAANVAANVAAHLIYESGKQLILFAPVVHGHQLPVIGDHEFWMRQCKPFLLASKSLIVVKMPGWAESKGVSMEIGWAADNSMPIFFLDV